MPPSVFSIQVNAAFTDWSFVMSHSTAFNWPSDPNSPSRNCSTLSLRLDNPQTIIPARHNSEQIALPMPLLAPVTTATFPCHRSIVEHQNEIVVSSPQIDTQMNQMFDQIEISAQHSRFRSHYTTSNFERILIVVQPAADIKKVQTDQIIPIYMPLPNGRYTSRVFHFKIN